MDGVHLYLFCVLIMHCHYFTNAEESIFFKFTQPEYEFTLQRVEIASFDEKYIKYAKLVTFKYNRTTTALNASICYNYDIGEQLQILVQMFKFLSNEYRHFPVRFMLSLCDSFKFNIGGVTNVFNCGNMKQCNLKKNVVYTLCNFTPENANLPPYLPNGEYMSEFSFIYEDKTILLAKGYARIEHLVKIRN